MRESLPSVFLLIPGRQGTMRFTRPFDSAHRLRTPDASPSNDTNASPCSGDSPLSCGTLGGDGGRLKHLRRTATARLGLWRYGVSAAAGIPWFESR